MPDSSVVLPLIPQDPQVRLVAPVGQPAPRDWRGVLDAASGSASAEAAPTPDPDLCPDSGLPARGRWRVRGVAGAGVSSLLVDTAVDAVRRGADPAGIVIVTHSKEAAGRLRQDFTRRLVSAGLSERYVADSSIVRSVHSLAFGLLRRGVEGEPRLLTGAEHDAMVRELIAGQLDDGRHAWPADAEPALPLVGFSRQLRDFLLRAAERGVSAGRLIELGEAYARPMWTAAGHFLQEYQQVNRLAGMQTLSASELVSAALAVVADQPTLLDQGWHTVLIDDAQHLDPYSGELLGLLWQRAELAVVGGDVEQSIFRFRGATPEFFQQVPAEHEVELTRSRRHPRTTVLYADSPLGQAEAVAAFVRRSHLIDDVPWSQIGVIVRQTADVATVRRQLLAAGVPVHLATSAVILSEQPLVSSIILAVRSLSTRLNNNELEELVTGPIGGADPVLLRRLLRGLRRFDMSRRAFDTLRDLLDTGGGERAVSRVREHAATRARLAEVLTQRELDILDRVQQVLGAAAAARDAGGSVEEVLWALWEKTGLAERLSARALRGGAAGSQADRDLDAVMSLFDAAGDFVERRDRATIDSFIEELAAQELPTGVRDRRASVPEAVTVLSAHSAAGREWRRVVITRAQDDVWPALGETGTMFDQAEFVDLVDRDIDPNLGLTHHVEILAEEKRLFHVAATRATDALLITAVDNPDGDEVYAPSRFITALAQERGIRPRRFGAAVVQEATAQPTSPPPAVAAPVHNPQSPAPVADDVSAEARAYTGLTPAAVIAELRRAVSDPALAHSRRQQAARQLARLAAAGVPGADPAQWWVLREPTSEQPVDARAQVVMSPSKVESLAACPLRAILGRVAEDSAEDSTAQVRGTLLHAFAEALARGADADTAQHMVEKALLEASDEVPWRREHAAAASRRLLERTRAWVEARGAKTDLVGVEMPVHVEVSPQVRISGRMDRLDAVGDEHIVVDFKTSATAATKAAAEVNPQLATYQLALSRGQLRQTQDVVLEGQVMQELRDGAAHPERAGGLLVYPATKTKTVTTREQPPLSEEQLEHVAASLDVIAGWSRGPELLAKVNDYCEYCQLRSTCPAWNEGAVTNAL